MSAAKRGGRFSYLNRSEDGTQTKPPTATESEQQNASVSGSKAALDKTGSREGGEQARGYTLSVDELTSVPKGQGRMKQQRSQLNVRIPTTLKRQASAKAVLEGRDIGEVVEVLLREYLER